jgi:hemerythrin
MVCFQGRTYLIDAGPGIHHSLAALGISGNEVAGIFHTHGHDDHFAGLTSLARADRRVPYFAVAPVRSSVMKKYAALTGRVEETFYRYFEPRDLVMDQWNRLDEGLEVLPVFSPHPVETTVLFFRVQEGNTWRSYAHLADISAFEVLRKMVTEDPKKNGISQRFYEGCTAKLLAPADVKKIDVGGGLIHGMAEDFAEDSSGKRYLSHFSSPLTETQKKVGTVAVFGQEDVLIKAQYDALKLEAQRILLSYFPGVPQRDVQALASFPLIRFAPGTIVQTPDIPRSHVFLVVSGIVERGDPGDEANAATLSSGSLLGEIEALRDESPHGVCRAISHVTALPIPREAWMDFLRNQRLMETMQQLRSNREFLQSTWLFGEMASFPLQNRIAGLMERRVVKEDTVLRPEGKAEVFLLADGLVTVFLGKIPIENVTPGDFFGEESVLRGTRELPRGWEERFARSHGDHSAKAAINLFEARALLDSTLYAIPGEAMEDIPIVQWKLMETYERRLKNFRSEMRFEWNDAFAVGIPSLDGQHREMFSILDGISAMAEGREPGDGVADMVDRFVSLARSHLHYEETLLSRAPDSDFQTIIRGNDEFLKKLDGVRKYLEKAPADALQTTVAFLKDWTIDHSLLENRRMKSSLS